MPEPKPTVAEIIELHTEYRDTVYAQMHAEQADDQKVINASSAWGRSIMPTYLKGFPKGFVPKVMPIAKKGIEIAKNSVQVGEEPEVTVPLKGRQGKPLSDALEAKRIATEGLYKALIYGIAQFQTVNPFSDLLDKQYGLGQGTLTFPYRFEKMPKEPKDATEQELEDYEAAKRDAWCWDVYVTHPLNVYQDPTNDPPEHFITEDEITARAAKARYPDLELPPKGKVKRLVYCSAEWYCVLIDGQPAVEVTENPMGVCWYETAWSGLGSFDEKGGYEFLGVGLVRHAKDVIAEIVLNTNIADAVRSVAAFTPRQITHPDGEAAAIEAARKLVFGPNELWPTEAGVTGKPLEQNVIPPSVAWSMDSWRPWLEILFGPTILTGNYQEQTASGLAQRVNLAETPFRPGKVAAEQAIGNMLRKMAKFIKRELGDSYSLPYRDGQTFTVKTDDILDDAPIVVNLKPVTDEERAFNAVNDGKLLESGAIDMTEFRKRQNITDGEKMDRGRVKDTLRFHPDVIQAAAQVIAQQLLPAPPTAPAPTQTMDTGQGPPVESQPVNDGRMITSPAEQAMQGAEGLFRVPQAVGA